MNSAACKTLLGFVLLLTTLCFAHPTHAATASHSDSFVVGTASGYAPYVSLNDKGEYEGFDIDLAHRLADKLHKKLVLRDLGSMPSLLLALQKQKIDAVIWAVSITSDRQKEMTMIYYQGEKELTLPFAFWKKLPEGVQTIDDLAKQSKRMISVEAGSYQEGVLRKYPSLQLRFLDKITDALMEVQYGKSLCTAVDPSLVARLQAQYPELQILHLPLPATMQSLGNGICIHPSNQGLTEQVSRAIDELRADGTIAQLEVKWGLKNQAN